MFWIWIRTGKPDPAMMANGMLAGLVIITAPCAFVDPWVAMVLGIIAGVVVIEAVFFIERKLKIDDPVGAISVHGVCGTPRCARRRPRRQRQVRHRRRRRRHRLERHHHLGRRDGVAEGRHRHLLRRQRRRSARCRRLAGALAIWIVMFGIAFAFFKIQNALTKGGIRSDADDEIAGLDLPEMGVLAYPDFAGTHESLAGAE